MAQWGGPHTGYNVQFTTLESVQTIGCKAAYKKELLVIAVHNPVVNNYLETTPTAHHGEIKLFVDMHVEKALVFISGRNK